MRYRVYIEDKTGTYVDVSDRLKEQLGSFGFEASPDDGSAKLTPPSALKMSNPDGMFTYQTGETGSRWYGDFSERKVKVTVVVYDGEEVDLAVFRIVPEKGVRAKSDGTAVVKLEPMERKLQRGDASDVTYKNGWHQQIPFPTAIDLLRKPEASGSMSLPSSIIEYEGFQYGASTLGRPGDYQDDGFHEIREPVVDVTYNHATGVFCFCTLRNAYEWDPSTGVYEELSVSFTLDSDHDFLAIWFRKAPSGSDYYLFLSAPREESSQTNGAGYYQPRDQYKRELSEYKTWMSNVSSARMLGVSDDACLAPVIYRDVKDKVSSSQYLGIGADYDGDGSAGAPYRENALLPFNQYPYFLWSRKTEPGEEMQTGTVIWYLVIDVDDSNHPLMSDALPTGHSWSIARDNDREDREEFDWNRLRAGRGYYASYMGRGVNWSTGTNYPGFRHSLGNGPMFDMVFMTEDADFDDQWHALFYWEWTGTVWRLNYRIYSSSGTQGSNYISSAVLPAGCVPTFVRAVMDQSRDNDHRIYVVYGWMDYGTIDATNQVSVGGDTYQPCRSGVGVATSGNFYSSSISWAGNTSRQDLLTFTEASDTSALCNKYYNGGAGDEEGRWSPIGCSIAVNGSVGGAPYLHLNIFCIDRMDCAGGDQGNGVPYRLYYLRIKYMATGYIQVVGDGGGDGERKSWICSMPPMGMTSEFFGAFGQYARTWSTYFYNTADGGIYAIPASGSPEPQPLGFLNVSDPYLGMGALAFGNKDDQAIHQVCGVTSPVFPLTGETRWPAGLYYGFFVAEQHSGRVGLLDLENLDKLRAIGLLAQLGDSVFYFGRDGAPNLKKRPTSDDAASLTLAAKDFGSLERYPVPVVNYATRSVHDVIPGEPKVKLYLGPESFWNVEPRVTGFGIWPVDVEIRCIGGGLVSQNYTRWGFRRTTTRITTKLSQAASVAAQDIYVDIGAEIEEGDFVTLSTSDYDRRIGWVDYSLGKIHLTSALDKSYAEGDPVWIDKTNAGRWSDQVYLDGGQLRSVTECATTTGTGDKQMEVTSAWPFAVGVRFQAHHASTPGSYTDTVYIVTRVITAEERDDDTALIYFETADGGGTDQPIHAGAPLACFLEFTPTLRAATVGQTGLVFSAYGAETSDMDDDDEQPVVEGDKLTVSYPGLICEKNSISKATARDINSVSDHGEKKVNRIRANKFMDLPLATMDVNRRVRRGADPKIGLVLGDVIHPGVWELEPLDVIEVYEPRMLADRSADGYKVKGMVTKIGHKGERPDVTIEELADPFDRDRSYGEEETWDPSSDEDLVFFGSYKNIHTGDMDENGDALSYWLDQSPAGNDGEVDTAGREPTFSSTDGGCIVPTPGNYDNFDLGDDLQVFSNTNGLELWILYQDTATNGKALLSQYETSGDKRVFYLTDYFCYLFEDADTFNTDGRALWSAPGDGNYHTIRITWTPGGKVQAYLDGVWQAESSAAINDLEVVTQAVRIFARKDGTDYNCDNPTKLIAIFDTALTSAKADLVDAYFDDENPDT